MTIRELYKKIEELKDFTPSTEVNELFTQLVEKSVKYSLDAKLTRYEISRLQILSAKAEYELEKYWSLRIISSNNSIEEFKKFPYIKNYIDLTKLEIFTLMGCSKHDNHEVVFIGGGPLPMTAIVLSLYHNIKSTIIDMDEDAVNLSEKLIKQLDLDSSIKIIKSSGERFNYKDYNTVFVAALAGLNSSTKRKIFLRIKATSKSGTHIVARSSWGNRRILYRPLSSSIFKIFKPILRVDPFNDVVNSAVILRNE